MECNFNEIGERIREMRKKQGISSQDDLRELLSENFGFHIGRNSLSRIENGEKDSLSFDFLYYFSKLVNCDIGYLLGEYDEKTQSIHQICEYTGLTEKSIELLNNAKKIYELYDESQYTLEAEEASIESEDLLFFINSVLEFDGISYISSNFRTACFYQPREKIAEKYHNFLKRGIANSKNEKNIFSKMKSIGWETKEYDLDYENTETVDFQLFALNRRFKDLVEEIGKKNYLNIIEKNYLNKK